MDPLSMKPNAKMRLLFALLICFSSALAALPANEIQVNLQDPVYQDGVLTTHRGGVICGPGFRVQARNIRYTRKGEVARLEADGDLLLEYGRDVFTGQSVDLDLNTRAGLLINARSQLGLWYVGGRRIALCADRSYVITDAFVTTCEGLDHDWGLYAKCVRVTQDGILCASNVQVRLLRLPIFWLPRFRASIRSLLDAPIRYRVQVGGTQGTKMGLRYRFFSWRDFNAYLRLEYFLARGPGVALETEYCPAHRASRLYTQSYLAYDRSIHEPDRSKRYLLAGLYHDCFCNGLYTLRAHYDYSSDREVATDYRTSDFNLHSTRLTEFQLRRQSNDHIVNLFARVRLNDFQTVNQELPSVVVNWRPLKVGCSPFIFTTRISAGYHALAFAQDALRPPLQPTVNDYQAGRAEADAAAYLPLRLGALRFLGTAGFVFIGYSASQEGHARGVALGELGADLSLRFSGCFRRFKHVVDPYLSYELLTPPTLGPNSHDIFSIRDGYSYLNLLRVGLRNRVYSKDSCGVIARPLWLDLYAYAFLNPERTGAVVPRIYADLEWAPRSWLSAHVQGAWSAAHDTVDHLYVRLEATWSEDTAFSIEPRYRSRYVWRKADRTNFILDVARPEQELIDTLSDRRYTVLLRLFHRVTPSLNVEIQTRHGWRMRDQKPYNEGKITLRLSLPCRWNLSVFYEHLVFDDSFGVSLTLGNPRRVRRYGNPLSNW